jgi:hypothetical protein
VFPFLVVTMLQNAAHTASPTARFRVGKMASQWKIAPAGRLSNKKKKQRSQKRRTVSLRLPNPAKLSKLPPSTQAAAPAAANSNTATTPSSPCPPGTETEFELSSTFCRTDHYLGANQRASANSDTDNASTDIPHTTTTAAATRTANKLRTLPRRSLQSIAKRFGIKANAKSTIIIVNLIDRGYISPAPASASPPCTSKVENETEPCNKPQCRSNHFTEQSNQDDVTDDDDNDNANAASTDRPPDSSTAPVPHDATTTANAIVSSTSNTKSKKRGSHPASRRQRKRAAAAAVAASAASSPEHMSPTTSPSPDPKETERKLYNLLYAASTTTAPTPPAQMSDRVA